MLNAQRRRALGTAYQICEGLIVVAAFLAALTLSQGLEPAPAMAALGQWPVAMLVAAAVLAWHSSLAASGLYQSRRLVPPLQNHLAVLKCSLLTAAVVASGALLLEVEVVDGDFLVVFWALTAALALGARLAVGVVLRRLRVHNRNIRHVVIVGRGPRGKALAEKLRAEPAYGYRVLGFVDGSAGDECGRSGPPGEPLLGTIDDLPRVLSSRPVDEVVLALPVKSFYGPMHEALRHCEQQGICAKLLTDIFELRHLKHRVEDLGGIPAITMYRGPEPDWRAAVKRGLDVAVSATGLLLLSPLLALIAVRIKTESPGPVFFVQERVGLNKRTFRMFKFRSMVVDAESRLADIESRNEVEGPVFKVRDDPRITPFGRFLRRTSLDELPQLFNVLRGDMSLVGPRPLPVRDVAGFEEDWQRRRFSVRPGLTCTWQISGRNDIPFGRWMQMDLEYIDHWSLQLDLKILLLTIPAVLAGRGAS